jgi:NitT/TauT family transport system permease protein
VSRAERRLRPVDRGAPGATGDPTGAAGGAPGADRGAIGGRSPARGGRGSPAVAGGWRRRAHVPLALGLGAAFLLAWEWASRTGVIEPVLFPPPTKVAAAWWFLVRSDFFPRHFRVTIVEILAGFALGGAIGFGLGLLLATVRLVRLTLYPYIIAFQALPKVVLAPLFIIWFGFGPASKIVTATAICFFPVMINTVVGLRSADDEALKLFRSLRATRWQTFVKLRFPNALPQVFAGLKTSLTLAMIGAIVAEFLTAADLGLGRLVAIYNLQIQVHMALAVVVIVSALGILGVWIMEVLDRRLIFWRDR